jgi:hypothetical protein
MPGDAPDKIQPTVNANGNFGPGCKFIEELIDEYKKKPSVSFEESLKVIRAGDECHMNIAFGDVTKAELAVANIKLRNQERLEAERVQREQERQRQ